MLTVIGMLLAVVVTVLSPTGRAAVLPSAPPLPPVGTTCASIAPLDGDPTAPTIAPSLTTSAERVVFHGLVLGFSLQDAVAASSGYLYLRLDAERPQYVAWYPGGDPKGTMVVVSFEHVAPGRHVLDFGLASVTAPSPSFGRFCFDVIQDAALRYDFPYVGKGAAAFDREAYDRKRGIDIRRFDGLSLGRILAGADSVPEHLRIAVRVATEAFQREAWFKANDRDLAHYEVETYGKDSAATIEVTFRPLRHTDRIACSTTGPVDATYIVDIPAKSASLAVKVC